MRKTTNGLHAIPIDNITGYTGGDLVALTATPRSDGSAGDVVTIEAGA